MKTSIFVIVFISLVLALVFYLTKYKSAFEADQACHFSQFQLASHEELVYGCDHDTETQQWILYQKNIDNQPALVIERFRY